MKKLKITILTPYGGDLEDNNEIIAETKTEILGGDVSIEDFVAAGECEVFVEVLGEFVEPDVSAEEAAEEQE